MRPRMTWSLPLHPHLVSLPPLLSYSIHGSFLYAFWICQVSSFLRAFAPVMLSSWNALPLAVPIADLFKSFIYWLREAFPNYSNKSWWPLLFSTRPYLFPLSHVSYFVTLYLFVCSQKEQDQCLVGAWHIRGLTEYLPHEWMMTTL